MWKPTNRDRGSLKELVVALLCLGVAGCGIYRLGSSLPPGVNSVYVPVFTNESGEPLIETECTSATAQEFQKDGSLELREESLADARLNVTVNKFEVEPIRYEQDSTKAGREYRIKVTAAIVLTKTRPDQVILDRTVTGETTFFLEGDMTNARRAAVPALATDLAHQIVKAVVDFW